MGNEAAGTGISKSFVKTYSTFSGVDITALFDDMTLMTVQGIAISITREKVPVYVFGRSRPVSISRGKIGIAGTLQFVLFDRDALYALTEDKDHWYYAHADEVNWLTNQVNYADYHSQVNGESPAIASSQLHKPDYMNQVWPFDVTLIAQNEYGHGAWSAIIGVEVINEGGGISMDDLTNEEQATYIAIHRTPWSPLADAWGENDEQHLSYEAQAAVLTSEGEIGIGDNTQGTTA